MTRLWPLYVSGTPMIRPLSMYVPCMSNLNLIMYIDIKRSYHLAWWTKGLFPVGWWDYWKHNPCPYQLRNSNPDDSYRRWIWVGYVTLEVTQLCRIIPRVCSSKSVSASFQIMTRVIMARLMRKVDKQLRHSIGNCLITQRYSFITNRSTVWMERVVER